MPPVTPRRPRATLTRLALVRVLDLALGDLFEGHRQVVLRAGLDERWRIVVEGALTELGVVVVYLPRALGSDDHEGITLVDVVEQLVDAWMNQGLDMVPVAEASLAKPSSESAGLARAFGGNG